MNRENDITLSSLKLNKNLNILSKVNEILYKIYKSENKLEISKDLDLNIFLHVLNPIIDRMEGKLSQNINFDEENVIKFLQRNYPKPNNIKNDLTKVRDKINTETIEFDKKFFTMMNTIVNAIQIESGLNFKKMRLFP